MKLIRRHWVEIARIETELAFGSERAKVKKCIKGEVLRQIRRSTPEFSDEQMKYVNTTNEFVIEGMEVKDNLWLETYLTMDEVLPVRLDEVHTIKMNKRLCGYLERAKKVQRKINTYSHYIYCHLISYRTTRRASANLALRMYVWDERVLRNIENLSAAHFKKKRDKNSEFFKSWKSWHEQSWG